MPKAVLQGVLAVALLLLLPDVFAAGVPESGLRQKLLRSAARIRYERGETRTTITGHGTAFCADLSKYGYSGRTYLLSAAHNVLDDTGRPFETLKLEIEEPGRTVWSRCRVLAFDKDLDLCLLESNDPLPEQVELSDADVEAGAKVVLAGSPRGVPVALYDGVVIKRFEGGTVRSSARLPFDHGCSGGPFFNSAGKAAGVAVAGVPKDGDLDKQMGLFVPVSALASFLERHRNGPARESTAVAQVKPEPRRDGPVPAAMLVAQPADQDAPRPRNTPPKIALDQPRSERALPEPKAANTAAHAADAALLAAQASARPSDAAARYAERIYLVQDGDSLSTIAKRLNVPMSELVRINKLKDPNLIYPGVVLRVP